MGEHNSRNPKNPQNAQHTANSKQTAKRKNRPGAGRPVKGVYKQSLEIKLRIDPYLLSRFDSVCRLIQIPRSDGMRTAMIKFIESIEKEIEKGGAPYE